MSTNYLVGSFETEYAGLALHARYESGADEINQNVAAHTFIKVDGAYQEFMGSGADAYRFAFIFLGADWIKQFAAFVAHFHKNPKGLLVHPIYGKKRVAWKSISNPVNVGAETNATTATVQFAEDNLDPAAGQPVTVGAQAQAVNDNGSLLTSATSGFSASTVAQVAAMVSLASTYAASALAVAQSGTLDPTLPSALGAVETSTSLTLATLASDPLALPTLATTRTLAIQTYVACLAVSAAVASLQPTVEQVTIAGSVSLSRLCSDRYGAQASSMRDLVLALNRIPSPALIPGGTVLQMPTATV